MHSDLNAGIARSGSANYSVSIIPLAMEYLPEPLLFKKTYALTLPAFVSVTS